MKNTNRFNKMDKSESLSIYLRDISKYPLLTLQEEKECLELSKKGDIKAKEKLINSNLRFVVKVAKKYRNNGLSFSDLISEGNIGLTIAAEKFDNTKEVRFISYAVWWIKQTILKAISEKSRTIRLPVNRLNELTLMQEKIDGQSGKSIEDIALSMNIDRDVLNTMINASRGVVSFDEPIKNGEMDSTIGDTIKDEYTPSPEDNAVNAILKEDISKLLSKLSTRESAILKYRFGLEGGEPHSLVEVGMAFNLTKERIRQIEKKTIEKLRSFSFTKSLQAYVA